MGSVEMFKRVWALCGRKELGRMEGIGCGMAGRY